MVAVGGDGTINQVVNGFFHTDGERPMNPKASLGVLPAGTGGDFVRTLGVSRQLSRAALELREAVARPLDVGRLTFINSAGTQERRHFVNIASFGISAWSISTSTDPRRRWAARSRSRSPRCAPGSRTRTRRCASLDGREARQGRIYNVAIANGRYFGGSMKVAPDAAIDDGLFDVVTMGDMGMADMLFRGLDIYSGKHLQIRRCRSSAPIARLAGKPVVYHHRSLNRMTLPKRLLVGLAE